MKIFVNKKQDRLAYEVGGMYYRFLLSHHEGVETEKDLVGHYVLSESKAPYSREISLSQLQELCNENIH